MSLGAVVGSTQLASPKAQLSRSTAPKVQATPKHHSARSGGSKAVPEPQALPDPPTAQGPKSSSARSGGSKVLASPHDLSVPSAAHLRIYADTLGDFEATRISMSNRMRALQAEGLGDSPEHARLRGVLEGLQALEHGVELELKRALRKHPLGPWVKSTVGIGEKQGARLLASIGDPAWNDLHDRPRTLGELWAYCGYHTLPVGNHTGAETHSRGATSPAASLRGAGDHTRPGSQIPNVPRTAPSRKRGEKSNWNSDAKMRAFLVAESCMKQMKSPYRAVYDSTRAKYDGALHDVPCRRCGPSGHPAQVGSPLSAGHQHARAIRAVAKEVLRDLWTQARMNQHLV